MARNSFEFIGDGVLALIPQQGKLMGSSAQNSSCALCRRRVRFNEVPKKVPEKVWEALVQRQVTFNRVLEKVPETVWEALVQSQVRFNRVPEKVPVVPEKVWEALVQSQVRFNRICGHLTHGNPADSQHAPERFVKIKRCGC